MKTIIFFLMAILSNCTIFSQNCEVLVSELKGKYNGDCKNGLADGKGEAIGIDQYEGHWIKGYPDGEGTYTYANGNYYKGSFKRGLFEGKGELHMLKQNKTDSAKFEGYFVKGKFYGAHKNNYDVNVLTNKINDVGISRSKGTGDEILIIIKSTTGGAITNSVFTDDRVTLHNGTTLIPVPKITDIQLEYGNFITKYDDESNPMFNKYFLRFCTFPIRFLMRIGSEAVKLEFFEPGNWTVKIQIDQ